MAELEMDMDDIFDQPASPSFTDGKRQQQSDSDEDDAVLEESTGRGRRPEMPGGNSESAKSSTLGVAIDQDSFEEAPQAPMARSPMLAIPLAAPMRGRAPRYPSHGGPNYRMGTSVPVDIPFLRQGGGSPEEGGEGQVQVPEEEQYLGTFIPPHQLSMIHKNPMTMFSLRGESPASVFKRERLKQRNAILTSTGFLEGHMDGRKATPTAPGGDGAAAAVVGSMERPGLACGSKAGGLSQALGTQGSGPVS